MDFRALESYIWDKSQLQLSGRPGNAEQTYWTQPTPTPTATSPLDHVADHPWPEEPSPESGYTMNHKGSAERYDDLPAQTLSLPPRVSLESAYDGLNTQQSRQTQFSPMAMNPLGYAESHSAPDETPGEQPSGVIMDYEGSVRQDDGPPVQAMPPPPTLTLRPGAKVKAVKASPPDEYSCGINCGGGFLGKHQCSRADKKFTIKCLWVSAYSISTCDGKFKTKNGFNRHFRCCHLDYDTMVANAFFCPVKGCEKAGGWGFTRYDNLLQHRRKVHKHDIPKTHVTPRTKAPKPYTRKTADPNRAGPSSEK